MNLLIGISRYTKNVIIKAYKHAIAADSVAVKTPEITPPIIITAVKRPSIASLDI